MYLASRWAPRASRSLRPSIRCISTKNGGLTRKTPRTGLPQNQQPSQPRRDGKQEQGQPEEQPLQDTSPDSRALLAQAAEDGQNPLYTPVHIPEDPLSILKENHPATSILANSTIIVQRQLEMMNLMIGFEQANRYVILDALGNHIGYLAEPQGNMLKRQMFKTHRGFTAHVFDKHEREVLRITRPFTWINSRIGVYDAVNLDPSLGYTSSDALSGLSAGSVNSSTSAQLSSLPTEQMRVIGEVQQQWAPLRRKYNLFLNRPAEDAEPGTPQLTAGELPLSDSKALTTVDQDHRKVNMAQWAYCDEPFLSWDFSLLSENSQLLGSVNRNFQGFGREIFTDTGVYALRMDAAGVAQEPGHIISHTGSKALREQESHAGMTLDQRAVMLATAVSIDFDYFSRHSGSGGMMPIPMWIPWGGGAAEGAGAAGAGAEAGGMIGAGEAAGGMATRGAGGALGAGEGAMAGAGSMAGYEAMQRSRGGQGADDASPQAPQDPYSPQAPQDGQSPQSGQPGEGESFWGEQNPWGSGRGGENDPWGGGPPAGGASSGGGGGGGDEGGGGGGDGGGLADWIGEFFDS